VKGIVNTRDAGGTKGNRVPVALRGRRPRSGFSLIEIMVAMAILSIIVLMMSTIYHQSTLAWDSGTRKTKGSVVARAVLGLISKDLSLAVVDTNILTRGIGDMYIQNGAKSIRFVTLGGTNSANTRVARMIRYEKSGASPRVMRYEYERTLYDPVAAGNPWNLIRMDEVADGVNDMVFETSPRGTFTTNLPDFVQIRMEFEKEKANISGVGAWSAGPDKTDGNADDITSW